MATQTTDWRYGVLQGLGAPPTSANLTALSLWANAEGMASKYNNPLATTKSGFGGVPINSAGVKSYPDVQSGVNATVSTLRAPGYAGIVDALKKDAGLSAIYNAINKSSWCRGCQAGQYPNTFRKAASLPPSTSVANAQPIAFQASEGDHCLVKSPKIGWGFASVGGWCLFDTNKARAVGGAAILGSGVIVGLLGIALLVNKAVPALPGPAGLIQQGVGAVQKRAEAQRFARAEAQGDANLRSAESQGLVTRRGTRRLGVVEAA